MRDRLSRLSGSVGVFAISMLLMALVCVWAWDAFVNGKLYYCTDGGSMDFIFGGHWVHHPESVTYVVPRPMDQADEIKAGWSITGLWRLWDAFAACSVLLSALFAGAFWRASSPNPAAPGNGASGSLFHGRRLGRAVPEPQRWAYSYAHMPDQTSKTGRRMPVVARTIAGLIGGGLLVGSLMLFFLTGPLNWKTISLSIGSAGLGGDLLHGAVRNRWPAAALLWLVGTW